MKALTEQIFAVSNYTDKIHLAVKMIMARQPNLSFTVAQIRPGVRAGYPWLSGKLTEQQTDLLDKLIGRALAKLVQQRFIKKVTSKVQVDSQWQWAATVSESGYVSLTSDNDVANTPEAIKASSRRALSARSLWRLNQKAKLGILHA
jgi:hypothetical protein